MLHKYEIEFKCSKNQGYVTETFYCGKKQTPQEIWAKAEKRLGQNKNRWIRVLSIKETTTVSIPKP